MPATFGIAGISIAARAWPATTPRDFHCSLTFSFYIVLPEGKMKKYEERSQENNQ
ncbi:MAG: hypothetical protein AB1461_04035 [Thermodesulfobacteriota bacterium]